MRFISMIRLDERSTKPPTDRLMADMGKLLDEMTRTGVLVDTAGLRPTAEGVRVRLRGGRVTTIDGPFTEAKEVIGGYAILQVSSKDEAIAHTRRFLEIHGEGWELECEVRELEGPGAQET